MRLELKAPYLELYVLLKRQPVARLEVSINDLVLQVQSGRPGIAFTVANLGSGHIRSRTVTLFGQKARRVV